MRVDITLDEPLENVILWNFTGVIGVMDYMPPINDSITRAMIDPDTRYDAIINIGMAMPLPNRPFRYVAQPLIGAPHNFKFVVCVIHNPLTRVLIAMTLEREPLLRERFFVVNALDAATTLIQQSRAD
ncbi:MAG: hypothetical protein AAF653_02215 [Chloroflexota bacterium]